MKQPFSSISTRPAAAVATDHAQRPRPNWKPFVFTPFYILPLAVLHALAVVGIQLLVKQHVGDEEEIQRLYSNETLNEPPHSLFIMREEDTKTFMMWSYLPTAVVVMIAALWEALDVKVRALAPFIQLASPEGGNAKNAMCLDYTSLFGLITPVSAIRRKHYMVALVSTIYIVASIALPAIAGGIFSIEWGSLSFSVGRNVGTKYAVVKIDHGIAVVNQVLHGLLAGGASVICVLLFLRDTGLYRDPNSIGGIASLISDSLRSGSMTVRVFQQIPSFTHSNVVEMALQNITFRLDHLAVDCGDGNRFTTYQLAVDRHSPQAILPIHPENWKFFAHRRDASSYWLMKRSAWMSEVFLWLGHASIISGIYMTAKVVAPDNWADREKPMIAKMVLTVCITIGGMMWVSIQRDIQLFAPWRRLSRGPSYSLFSGLEDSDYVTRGQFGSAARSIPRGAITVLWASFCVLMVQSVTVFAPPLLELARAAGYVDNMADFTEIGAVSGKSGLTLVVTGVVIHLVIFVNLLIFCFIGLARPFLPRAPTTIASQVMYLCRSDRLLRDFEGGTSMWSGKQVEQRLGKVEKRCFFGWFWWAPGASYCVGVEEYQQGIWWSAFSYERGLTDFPPYTRLT